MDKTLDRILTFVERLALAAFANRNGVPFLLLLAVVVISFQIGPENVTKIAEKVVDSSILCIAGWLLFVATLLTGRYMLNRMERYYERQNKHNEDLKTKALGQLELPLEDR